MKRAATDLAKHLEGWEVGVVTVSIVVLVAAVVVPRSAVPEGLPPAHIDRSELRAAEAKTLSLAEKAGDPTLPSDVALLGARVRAFGKAEYTMDDREFSRAVGDLASVAPPTLARFAGHVAALRAYQSVRFATLYRDYLRTGELSPELVELGGDSLRQLRREGWLQSLEQAPENSDALFMAIYKRRFNKLVGDHPELPLDPAEELALIDFFLAHPPTFLLADNPTEVEAAQGTFLLRQIDELSKLEPTYPAIFAKGIVLYRMGRYEAAASAFDLYVQTVEDGPYRLRAVNYLKSAIENSSGVL